MLHKLPGDFECTGLTGASNWHRVGFESGGEWCLAQIFLKASCIYSKGVNKQTKRNNDIRMLFCPFLYLDLVVVIQGTQAHKQPT